MSNTYCIINTTDISKCNFDLLITKDDENLRKTKDGSKCIIEWQVKPAFIDSIDVIGIYTHQQILAIIQQDEWQSDFPKKSINFSK